MPSLSNVNIMPDNHDNHVQLEGLCLSDEETMTTYNPTGFSSVESVKPADSDYLPQSDHPVKERTQILFWSLIL